MKKFLKEMNFDNVKKYKKQCLITLSGLPGSGKTYVAKELSKDIGIFVLSNDYVRNYFDYVIDNFGTKEELKCKINEISTDIGKCLTLKK